MTCAIYCLLIIWMVVCEDTLIQGQVGAIFNMKGLL
jgi:hypothetical protein